MAKLQRYNALIDLAAEAGKENPDECVIVEIGVHHCVRAKQMIDAAMEHSQRVIYFGFDLFEDFARDVAPDAVQKARPPLSMMESRRLIGRHTRHLRLYKGDSAKTVPDANVPVASLVFIDGDHSPRAILQDFRNVLNFSTEKTIIVLDDLYPDDLEAGCQAVVNLWLPSFNFVTLGEPDKTREGRSNYLVRAIAKRPGIQAEYLT